MAFERTFIMIKPDGVQRGLVGEIIKRLEATGFKLVDMKLMQVGIAMQCIHWSSTGELKVHWSFWGCFGHAQ